MELSFFLSSESGRKLSRLVQLHKTLTKRSKWFLKHSQNVQNDSKHDFSQNASKTCATVMQQVFKTTKMAYYFWGILWIYFKSINSTMYMTERSEGVYYVLCCVFQLLVFSCWISKLCSNHNTIFHKRALWGWGNKMSFYG